MASYIGVVNVDSNRPTIREIKGGMQYYEVVVGISEDNIYLLRRHPFQREEYGFSLVKKRKNSDSYATIRKDLTNGISFISNDEKAFVALCEALPGIGNDLSPKIFAYVPIHPDATAITHDYLITFPKDSVFRLTSVQSPDGNYAVTEERYISLWETPARTSQRFLALNFDWHITWL